MKNFFQRETLFWQTYYIRYLQFSNKDKKVNNEIRQIMWFFSNHNQKQPVEVFYKKSKKGFLNNFPKLIGKILRLCHFFNEVVGLRPLTFLEKKRLQNVAKILRTPLQSISGWLLLLKSTSYYMTCARYFVKESIE